MKEIALDNHTEALRIPGKNNSFLNLFMIFKDVRDKLIFTLHQFAYYLVIDSLLDEYPLYKNLKNIKIKIITNVCKHTHFT